MLPYKLICPVSLQMLATLVLEAAAGYHPRLPDLLATITNLQDCTVYLRRPGQRFRGPDGYNHAATCIQARIRQGA